MKCALDSIPIVGGPRIPRSDQRGVVLFVGLIMLLLLSLIGITAMQVTLMQERMAGNFYVQHNGFEAGESALAKGRETARVDTNLRFKPYMSLADDNQFVWTDWLTNQTFPPEGTTTPQTDRRWTPAEGIALPPNQNALHYYSVAAIGADASTDAKTALQGIYIF